MITSTGVIETLNTIGEQNSSAPSSQVDKTTFLKLMVMQLQHQDPTDPMDSAGFMTQLAQFNTLEQQINLNDQFEAFLSFQALTQATSMIGKEVQAIAAGVDGAAFVNGTVEEVILVSGVPVLKLSSGDEVPIQMVVRVGTDLGDS